ncbi:MAG: hypothetical protein HN457_02750 [Opitutales bacterium]|jgi:tetratricopeptide (TPR) repeat protein|nr:hypothetical protein [Opitutales bacterium]MDG2254797.1 hypothetical protein [Opitutaceae bacterium]MBT5169746.1 hypothetical protein [Opitutales bacterium]MBT5815418.1 hypothetical protein [Opitutales bacterium]MBT6380429.1 hypothetical protein [Opitutales bacterium]
MNDFILEACSLCGGSVVWSDAMIKTAKRLQYANGYLDLGMVHDAKAELDLIDEKDRSNSEVLSMRVRLFLEARNWKKMVTLSKQLVELDSDVAFGWVNWAYALRELERIEEAKDVAIRGLGSIPREAVLWFNLACYCSLLGEVEDSSNHLNKSIALEKSFEAKSVDDPDLDNLWAWIRSNE